MFGVMSKTSLSPEERFPTGQTQEVTRMDLIFPGRLRLVNPKVGIFGYNNKQGRSSHAPLKDFPAMKR
jgi:hypothetical protein